MPRFFKSLGLAIFLHSSFLWGAEKGCPSASEETLQKLQKTYKVEKKDLIFFASWCESCIEKIKTKTDNNFILIGAFDKENKIEEAYHFLKRDVPCFFGGKNAEKIFALKYVPFTLSHTE